MSMINILIRYLPLQPNPKIIVEKRLLNGYNRTILNKG